MPQKLLTYLFLFLGMFTYSQVVINEIDADNPGNDVYEFVELKSSTPNFPLDGYVLVFFNDSNSSSYYTFDLDGFVTDINGIIHFGNVAVTPAPVGIIPNNKIQNGPDVVALYLGNDSDFPYTTSTGTLATLTNLIDAVAYSNSNSTTPSNLMSILNLTVSTADIETTSSISKSVQRKNDGTYEVKVPTPGVNNDGTGIVLNYVSVSTSQTSYNEGNNFNVVFTTSQPVTTANLSINFTLNNGDFNNSDYSGNLFVTIPVGQSSAQTNVILTDDSVDEGDEEMLINVQPLSLGYVLNNNNITVRVYDNDFIVQSYGTPLSPTYGLVTPTIPAGYYDSLEGLSGNALKQAVQDIIANPAVVRAHNYGDIEFILKEADKNPLNSNQVWQMYVESPKPILDYQTGSSNIGVWNREHIFPQSRGGFSGGTSSTADGIGVWLPTNADDILSGHADAHHLRAEDGAENSTRSNRDYGSDYNGPIGSQGSWNGDVSRALFYMAVRYNGLNLVNGNPSDAIVGQIGDLATLLTWNTTDPRDDFEMNRNNYIYTWQMNRNPFIDYPNLADYIFGANFGQQWFSTLSTQNPIENRVAVYPNPASEYLIVSGLEGSSKVEIYTITGQLVKSQDFDNEIQINLDLHVGMYLVKVTNGSQSTTKKIIVK
ncbi:endonuclease [Flavobacterium cheniae]|uniref:Putative secreted protein (Por secretion system target) n=1 Tax=Flavobacterium cheniae TaxID=295428 RepID=A0A562KT61_9FLAO|nr:endonuclease [Flavobacterium cheniae]TDR25358.1 putative secreted protein (Por secretion system target) [Flavobacterium cheniae]TWH98455.1 putative secreted protein (Por secretion system target) [Flavobacterium cheniae]